MLEEPVRTTEAFVLGRLAVTPAWQTATTLQHVNYTITTNKKQS